jgi:hypothetical protein
MGNVAICGKNGRLVRGLVLIRIGKGHRCSLLLNVPRNCRSWDIAVSYYDESTLEPSSVVEMVHRYKGGKWDGIFQFFSDFPQALSQYDYFWLVDDDIETDTQQVNALFDYVREHQFELAQPALTMDSYFSHRLTLCCPGFLHRHTNLVEIMAPVLSARVLASALPYFEHTRSGFGIDWYWQRLVERPESAIAIIDAIAVRHARPLRQHLRNNMRGEGLVPEMERQQLVGLLNLQRIHAIATAGVTRSGRTVFSRFVMALEMVRAYWSERGEISKRRWGIKDSAILFYRQLFAPLGR